MHSVSIENFVKTIYQLSQDEQLAATGKLLAERLQVSNAAITDMARKLDEKGLVIYQKYKALRLTEAGRQMALMVVRRHRLWELFLHQVLKLDLQQVHREAELLEHQTSDLLITAIDDYLNHPACDPHGDPIPRADGVLPDQLHVQKLATLVPGQYRVVRLTHRYADLVEFYHRHRIELGAELKVVKRFEQDGSVEITLGNQTLVVSKYMADHVYCEKLKSG